MNSDITIADPKVTAKNDYNTTVIIDKHRAFLQRMFPGKLQQALNNSELIQAKTELEFREKALKISKESRLQSIKETYNNFLVISKGTIRKDRAIFLSRQLQELEVEINEITSIFYQLIEDQYAKLDKISIPFLKVNILSLIFRTWFFILFLNTSYLRLSFLISFFALAFIFSTSTY